MPELLEPPFDAAYCDIVDDWTVLVNTNAAGLLGSGIAVAIDRLMGEPPSGFCVTSAALRWSCEMPPIRADVACFLNDRLSLQELNHDEAFRISPNLMVQVPTARNPASVFEPCIASWLATGVQLALVAQLDRREIVAHRPGQPPRVHEGADAIELAPVLPGKVLKLDDIYKRFGK